MPKVRFKATKSYPRHLHKRGGPRRVPYGKGETTKVLPHTYLLDGDTCDMTDFQAQWCLNHLPENFSLVAPPKPRSRKTTKSTPKTSDGDE